MLGVSRGWRPMASGPFQFIVMTNVNDRPGVPLTLTLNSQPGGPVEGAPPPNGTGLSQCPHLSWYTTGKTKILEIPSLYIYRNGRQPCSGF